MSEIYNSYFFTDLGFASLNYMDKEHWFPFFSMIADNIVKIFNPKTVLDAGCAVGYLVEALRDKGVEAYGFDVSEFAISHVREDLKPYFFVHSITDKIPEKFPHKYDLVITIEVMEHLTPENGSLAIKNLCQYSDTVIFTSSPHDITDMTHINVRLAEYWCKEFANNLFFREYLHPVDFICPWAMVFKKYECIEDAVFDQEMYHRISNHKNDLARKNEIDLLIQQKDADYHKMVSEKDREYIKLTTETDAKYIKLMTETEMRIKALQTVIENQESEYSIKLDYIKNIENELITARNCIKDIENDLTTARNNFIEISNASFWKMTKPFRMLIGFMKGFIKKNDNNLK